MERPNNRFQSIAGIIGRHADLIRRIKARNERSEGEHEQLAGRVDDLMEFVDAVLVAGAILDDDPDRMAAQTIVDYWSNMLRGAGHPAPSDELAEFDARQLPTLAGVACPYPGDDPIRDSNRLFGRDEDVRSVLTKLEREPVVVIRGPGGCGKSSVLQGVLPRAAAIERTIVSLRPGAKPFERLAKALELALGHKIGAKQLREPTMFARLLADVPGVLLAIDQFEDLFVLVSDLDRQKFDKLLVSFLTARPTNKLLVCVNDGLIDHFDWMPETTQYIDSAQMISLQPLDGDALEQAIVQPALAVELTFGARVVEQLIRELLGDPAALPLLQFTMRRLWDMPDRKNRITLAMLERLGDPRKAFEAEAEARFKLLAPVPEDAVRRVLLELVHIDAHFDYHRQPNRFDRLHELKRVDVHNLLPMLVEFEFVRVIDDEVVELRGDAYLHHWSRLVGWIKAHRQRPVSNLGGLRKALPGALGVFGAWLLLGGFLSQVSDGLESYLNTSSRAPMVDKNAAHTFEIACNVGDMDGCNILGWLYLHGNGVEQDYGRARNLYERACEGSHMDGCNNLGGLYHKGQGIEQDYGRARDLYELACEGGNMDGCNNLGGLYLQGQGVPQDYDRASVLYKLACNGGNMQGCNILGWRHLQERDYGHASELFELACNGSDMDGCNVLGGLYRRGQGVEQDDGRASVLFEIACNGGNMQGCNNLGEIYLQGQGVKRDYGRARELLELACNGGNMDGCNNLE